MSHWKWDPLDVPEEEMNEYKHLCCTEVPYEMENSIYVVSHWKYL